MRTLWESLAQSLIGQTAGGASVTRSSSYFQMSLDEISMQLQRTHQERLQADTGLQKMIQQRSQLPVFAMKQEIMNAIYDNPVTIIRGNTGCGKTTQVGFLALAGTLYKI